MQIIWPMHRVWLMSGAHIYKQKRMYMVQFVYRKLVIGGNALEGSKYMKEKTFNVWIKGGLSKQKQIISWCYEFISRAKSLSHKIETRVHQACVDKLILINFILSSSATAANPLSNGKKSDDESKIFLRLVSRLTLNAPSPLKIARNKKKTKKIINL